MLRLIVVVAALAASPAQAEDCSFVSPSGAELWFDDPMTMTVADYGQTESCRLLSAGTGIVLTRGVDCEGKEPVALTFADEEMNTLTFRDVEWQWTCPDNRPLDIGVGE